MSRPVLAAALLLALAPTLSAQEADAEKERSWQLFGSLDTLIEFNQTGDSGDEDYEKYKGLFNLNLVWSRISAGVQLEYLYFSDVDLVDPGDLDRLREGFELRKYYAEYIDDRFDVRLGTSFTSFGRGMTLYVQKNDTVGIDEPIHGLLATANLGPFELTALGGKVTEPLLENRYGRRFEDRIWGARALANLPLDLYVGASYAAAGLESVYQGEADDEAEVWSVEAGGYSLAGYLDIHGEWAEIEQVERGRTEDGFGRYLSMSSTIGPVTLLGEFKDYYNFDYRYNNPPTAGPTVEAYDHDDVKGPRLVVSWDIAATGTLLHAGYGDFDTHDHDDPQVEWIVGVDETVGPIFFQASYFRRDFTDSSFLEEHILADLHVTTLGGRGDVSVGYDVRKETSEYFNLGDHKSHLTFSLAPWGSVSVRYAWDARTNLPTEEFWAGEIEYFPVRAVTLALFAGAAPGGLVCSGGQCRQEPPFEGVRARFSWRF